MVSIQKSSRASSTTWLVAEASRQDLPVTGAVDTPADQQTKNLPQKADMCSAPAHVRFGPKADMTASNRPCPNRSINCYNRKQNYRLAPIARRLGGDHEDKQQVTRDKRRPMVACLVATFSKGFFFGRTRKTGRAGLLHNGRSRRVGIAPCRLMGVW